MAASMDQLESADILRTFISAYGEAWNTNDVEAIMKAYTTPCFVVKGGHVLLHNDEAAKRQYFAELLASNNQQGPHAWSIGDLKPRQLGSDAALLTVRWIARRPDQSLLWDFFDSYLLALEEGQWRILGDVVHN